MRADTVDHESEIIEARIKNWIEELPIVLEHSNLIFHVGIYDVDAQFDDMGSAVRRRDVDVTRLYSNASVAKLQAE